MDGKGSGGGGGGGVGGAQTSGEHYRNERKVVFVIAAIAIFFIGCFIVIELTLASIEHDYGK